MVLGYQEDGPGRAGGRKGASTGRRLANAALSAAPLAALSHVVATHRQSLGNLYSTTCLGSTWI